ncbi:glycoside hydrolase family 15 protein [Candidatus Saccharibacteria bacterium]|nr:glycoside hydrolase family 15 protein [Candidatus Saccharibacteria bacterium]
MSFEPYPSGLFPASVLPAELLASKMDFVWIRDNCHVAMALDDVGQIKPAVNVARALLKIFENERLRLQEIINGTKSIDVKNRPPARVDSTTLKPDYEWANAQNDSIGDVLWLVATLAKRADLTLTDEDKRVLDDIVHYLDAIEYWQDADNGYWEEARKVNASSVGTVLAGLIAYRNYFGESDLLNEMIKKGREALDQILPNETITPPGLKRETDAAQIFLVEPLGIVTDEQAEEIVEKCTAQLLRPHGLIRYIGDSYWTKDYRSLLGLGERTKDFSENMAERDQMATPDAEAQWTLFDSLLAIYWQKRFEKSCEEAHRQRARWHIERSLGQFVDTPDGWRIPEAYFLEGGKWVPNDHVPLLWTQANVLRMLAFPSPQ